MEVALSSPGADSAYSGAGPRLRTPCGTVSRLQPRRPLGPFKASRRAAVSAAPSLGSEIRSEIQHSRSRAAAVPISASAARRRVAAATEFALGRIVVS
jgi:hypothetical protein